MSFGISSIILEGGKGGIGLVVPLSLGYRYQQSVSGFFFRAALTPIILRQGGISLRSRQYSLTLQSLNYQGLERVQEDFVSWILPWAGLSIGWTF